MPAMTVFLRPFDLCRFAIAPLVWMALFTATAELVPAAEMRLRGECRPAGAVVVLGDVAEIVAADARQGAALAAIELFPAPPAGEQRVVRLREIQDLMLLRGMNLAEHQFSGSNEVTIRTESARRQEAAVQPLSAAAAQRIKRRICEALVKHLGEQSGNPQGWSVELSPVEADLRGFADPLLPLQVSGGSAPWTGSQTFEISTAGSKHVSRASITAEVRRIAPVLVALRPLARGAVVRDGDVGLQQAASADKAAGALRSVEDALGREMVRAVAVGMPISADSVRAPLAVRRGEVITVHARAGGIRIRTAARSRDDGGVGDLVAVESLLNRANYFARVSGIREVEVYARPPQVEAGLPDPANSNSVVNR
jgi:flagella basal body P-ring formation protein FlgA